MPPQHNRLIGVLVLGLSLVWGLASALVIPFDQITQPIGTPVHTWRDTNPPHLPLQPPDISGPPQSIPYPTNDAQEVNYICAQWDSEERVSTLPFETTVPTTETILTQPQHFVRLCNIPHSGLYGPWLMRSEYVRGLTPTQLRDVFALQYMPTEIVNVEIPASIDATHQYALWNGIAGPIAGWGDGGSVQIRIMSDFNGTNYFPTYLYPSSSSRQHQQPIGAIALSYQPMAACDNNHHIATYLDTIIPKAYSDLETIYNDLDYLNWNSPTNNPNQATYTTYFNQALQQVGPLAYDALSILGMRNALLASNTFFERTRLSSSLACARHHLRNTCLWIEGVGEFSDKDARVCFPGFNATSLGLAGGIDGKIGHNTIIGLGIVGLGNALHWDYNRGKAHSTNLEAGIYASYAPSCFFIDGIINGGYTWSNAHRHIIWQALDNFTGLDRTAHSYPEGYDIAVHLQSGCNIGKPWCFAPLARVSYFYVHQNHFKEKDANSLNLDVDPFHAHTLRLHLGAQVSRVFADDRTRFVPQINAGWAHDFMLDKRTIDARLIATGGTMTIQGYHKDLDSFVGGVTLNVLFANAFTIFGHYDAEVREHFSTNVVALGARWLF